MLSGVPLAWAVFFRYGANSSFREAGIVLQQSSSKKSRDGELTSIGRERKTFALSVISPRFLRCKIQRVRPWLGSQFGGGEVSGAQENTGIRWEGERNAVKVVNRHSANHGDRGH